MGETLTVERLEASPGLDGPQARGVMIAPDGSRVTFLRGRQDDRYQLDLWEYHIADGDERMLIDSVALIDTPEVLDEVEKARRERQRVFFRGIVDYDFAPDGQSLLFPLGGDLYYLPLDGEPRRLTDTPATETDARVSPKGRHVSFIREQNLYLIDLETGQERALTTGGGGLISFGSAEFVAQEEMYRFTGYWWSYDERYIAFTRVDETPVTLVDRYEIGADGGVTTVAQRYPFAGEQNAQVQLFVMELATGERQEVPWAQTKEDYLVRVQFAPDGNLSFQRQSRNQQRLDLVFLDLATMQQDVALTETSDTWLNLHSDLRFFADGQRFLWTSQRDGFRHLYLYERSGQPPRQLTFGDWSIAETGRGGGGVRALVEDRDEVWFLAHKTSPLEKNLYRLALEGDQQPQQLTAKGGWHDVSVASTGAFFIDRGESPERPPYTAIMDRNGALLSFVVENRLDEEHPYSPYLAGHLPSEFGTLPGADGTPLYFELIRPENFSKPGSSPVVVFTYGGPHGAQVQKDWSVDFRQLLAREGFVVFTVDNRGTGRRNTAFDDPIYRAMGSVEVDDQVAGVQWLTAQPGIDASRVGIYGGSYGGYMTLLALFKAPEVFAAGAALSPVVDWRLYDTHYTERYMGDPAEGDAYWQSSPIAWVDGLQDPLLLAHGMADDNVFFSHSVQLMTALQGASQPFELMTYPGKRHRITGEAERVHLYRLLLDFFQRHLTVAKSSKKSS